MDNVEQWALPLFHIPMKKGCEMMTQITVRLPDEDKCKFAQIAASNDVTMSQLLRWFIRELNSNAKYGMDIHITSRQEEN